MLAFSHWLVTRQDFARRQSSLPVILLTLHRIAFYVPGCSQALRARAAQLGNELAEGGDFLNGGAKIGRGDGVVQREGVHPKPPRVGCPTGLIT
jgi:hypothetical protein